MGLADNYHSHFSIDPWTFFGERAFWGGGNAGEYKGSKFQVYFDGRDPCTSIISLSWSTPANQVRGSKRGAWSMDLVLVPLGKWDQLRSRLYNLDGEKALCPYFW